MQILRLTTKPCLKKAAAEARKARKRGYVLRARSSLDLPVHHLHLNIASRRFRIRLVDLIFPPCVVDTVRAVTRVVIIKPMLSGHCPRRYTC